MPSQISSIRIENEYSGLSGGLYPVDAAIWLGDQLVAFIEVDGRFHYRISANEKLRRRDELKEWLYLKHYPTIPMLRTRSLDSNQSGRDLALEICNLINQMIPSK